MIFYYKKLKGIIFYVLTVYIDLILGVKSWYKKIMHKIKLKVHIQRVLFKS